MGVIAVWLFISAAGERLTLQEFGAGVIVAGVCGVICALQRTVDLVIETSGRILRHFQHADDVRPLTFR